MQKISDTSNMQVVMSIDLYIIGLFLWLNAFVCYVGIWMTGSSYKQE